MTDGDDRMSGMRASDDDREATARLLRDHCVAGRLTTDELGERLQAAYAARTILELRALLRDLPRPAPAPAASQTAREPRPDRAWSCGISKGSLIAAVVPVLILQAIFGHFHIWYLIPAFMWAAGSARRAGHRADRRFA